MTSPLSYFTSRKINLSEYGDSDIYGIPFQKQAYAVFFVIILSLLRGMTYSEEIGIALEAPMAVLALTFCADTYTQEITSRRSEIWRLCPMKKRMHSIYRRSGIQELFNLEMGLWGNEVITSPHRPVIVYPGAHLYMPPQPHISHSLYNSADDSRGVIFYYHKSSKDILSLYLALSDILLIVHIHPFRISLPARFLTQL